MDCGSASTEQICTLDAVCRHGCGMPVRPTLLHTGSMCKAAWYSANQFVAAAVCTIGLLPGSGSRHISVCRLDTHNMCGCVRCG